MIRRRPDRVRGVAEPVIELARGHRSAPTDAEAVLWKEVRDRRLDGVKFRRQHPVDRFILDFCAPLDKLVIEIDGSSHEGNEPVDSDRDAILGA
jgi:very-short-patch-repair endonuclease